MNLQQFRYIRETIKRNFNLTETSQALFTSQPGVSKAIIEFEDETIERLQQEIAQRHGFVLTSHKMQLCGICPACSNK